MARKPIRLNPTLCERMKSERKAHSMSQADLAERLGISEQSLRHYELGHTGVSSWLIDRAATIFGCSREYLCGDTEYRTPEEEVTTEISNAVSCCNALLADREKKEHLISELFCNFFECKRVWRSLGEAKILTSDGKKIVFHTREEWEAFCTSFFSDAQKVFKYHIYEYRANVERHTKSNKAGTET